MRFGALLMVCAILPAVSSTAWPGDALKLYAIERSTLQTRNFTPIVNHEIFLANLGTAPLELDLASPIPAGRDVVGRFYPAFQEASLLPDPIFSPIGIAPKKTSHLPVPETVRSDAGSAFLWKGIRIPSGEAAVAQYDNYYGEISRFRTAEGLDIEGLIIRTAYSAREMGKEVTLSFDYEIENRTGAAVEELIFEAFLPVLTYDGKTERTLIELSEIALSSNLVSSRNARSDGDGNAASGVTGSFLSDRLPEGGKARFQVKLTGARTGGEAVLRPLLVLRGRCLSKRVWPQARITLPDGVDVGRFSYLSYNLVMPDPRKVVLGEREIKVVRAE